LLSRVFALKSRPWFADVAQLVEQRIRNAKVASSIPAIGTISNQTLKPIHLGWAFCFPPFPPVQTIHCDRGASQIKPHPP
jgi:hypothetical protein